MVEEVAVSDPYQLKEDWLENYRLDAFCKQTHRARLNFCSVLYFDSQDCNLRYLVSLCIIAGPSVAGVQW